MDGGAWWATVRGVAKSQTRLSDYTHILILRLSWAGPGPLVLAADSSPPSSEPWWGKKNPTCHGI